MKTAAEYSREIRSKRRAAGLCYRCGGAKDTVAGECVECRAKTLAVWDRWKNRNPKKAKWVRRDAARRARRNFLQNIRRGHSRPREGGRVAIDRVCARCGEAFVARNSRGRFCRYACRKQADRRASERQAEQSWLKRVRQMYGGELPPARVLDLLRLLREYRKTVFPNSNRAYPTTGVK